MTKAEEYFNELTAEIPDVQPGKMFGALCMKTPNGKAGAMLWKDFLVVKLDGAPLKEALSLKGTKTFEPMAGRPMNGWIQIPFTHKDKWKSLTLTSVTGVKELKAKEKKKK